MGVRAAHICYTGRMQQNSDDNQPLSNTPQPPEQPQPLYQAEPSQQPTEQAAYEFSWQSVEYIHRPKGAGWIVGLVIVALALGAFAYWLHAWTFIALILVMTIAFGVVAYRHPRTLHFKLSQTAVEIDGQVYPLSRFRSYGLLLEEDLFTLVLVPVKRFRPSITLFFHEAEAQQIVGIMSSHLPKEDIHVQWIENLLHSVGF